MSDLSLAQPLEQIPAAKTCARSSAIGPYCHILSLVMEACHLMQISVCPQALQSYIFLILWNKVELIH